MTEANFHHKEGEQYFVSIDGYPARFTVKKQIATVKTDGRYEIVETNKGSFIFWDSRQAKYRSFSDIDKLAAKLAEEAQYHYAQTLLEALGKDVNALVEEV